MAFSISNPIGLVTLASIVLLVILYLLKPKPFKKIIPSLIFLESGKKQSSFAAFFKRFIKDWIFFIQLFFLILICLAAIGLTTELFLNKVSRDVVIVIDGSASSNAVNNNGRLFDYYKGIAKNNLGIRNTIILIQDTPKIVARQTNLVNALRILTTLKPTESPSNVFDAMMMAGQVTEDADIMVLSDFIDTNNRNPLVAKQLLESRGFNVKLIKPDSQLSNIGIIKYTIDGTTLRADVRNFDNEARKIIVDNNGKELVIPALSVEQFTLKLNTGLNTVRIITGDNFDTDDVLYISLPDGSETGTLFITNKNNNYLFSALDSIAYLDIKKSEPPIINIDNSNLYVLSDIDYPYILPGTLEKIADKVKSGASLIIAAQPNLDKQKLKDVLPVDIISESNNNMVLFNTGPAKFEKYSYGQSSKYYKTVLKDNNSIVLAAANDDLNSPVIVSSVYGKGKILFYGIFDDNNLFRLNTQYPLFWIDAIEHLTDKQGHSELNIKTGSIIYGNNIKSPSGKRSKTYTIADEAGVYEVDNYKIAANLANQEESYVNKQVELDTSYNIGEKTVRSKQDVNLSMFFIIIALIILLFEVYIMKKRGDI